MNITEAMGWAEHTEKTTPEFEAMKALRKEVLRLREEAIPLDYVERLEQSNASLQQQADRGANCSMKLRIAKEHLQKQRKRAGRYRDSLVQAREALRENLSRFDYKNEPVMLEALNKIDEVLKGDRT